MTTRPRVLVTRAPHQASELAERLRALGAEPLIIPAIELAEPASWDPLDAALDALAEFQWLIFTSANAVEAFARRREGRDQVGQMLPRDLRVAAIGPATARALDKAGMPADLVPQVAVAESLAKALLPYAREKDGSANRFLLVRAEEAREVIPSALEAAGAEVVIAPAYRTVVPEASVELIRRMDSDAGLRADAITFTSSSSVRNLLSLFEAAGKSLPEAALRVSIGPITSATLADEGLPAHAEAPEATVAALADTVIRVLKSHHRGLER